MFANKISHFQENTRLKNEMIQMERAVADRLGYLQRHKEMTSFKVARLVFFGTRIDLKIYMMGRQVEPTIIC